MTVISAAARTSAALVALDPANPGAWMMLKRADRCLALIPNDATARYSLALMMRQSDKADSVHRLLAEAIALDPQMLQAWVELQRFDRALALAPDEDAVRYRHAMQRHALGDAAAAFREIDRLVARHPRNADLLCRRGAVAFDCGRADAAMSDFEAAIRMRPDHAEAHHRLAECLEALGKPQAARAHRIAIARGTGFVTESVAHGAAEARILFLSGTNRSDLPLNYICDPARFDRIFAFPGASADPAALAATLPRYDCAFNAVTDPDSGAEDLAANARFAQALNMSLLNAPDRVIRTRRDLVPALLHDIPMLEAPWTRRFSRSEIEVLAERPGALDHPVLIRPAGLHGGERFERLASDADLSAYVTANRDAAYYVTQYVDYRSADGQFRKYRFIFVSGAVFPYHCAIMDHWKVHYFRAAITPEKKSEEEAFLADWTSVFGGALTEAVREVAAVLDLDYAGMDCGLTQDGRLLIFEANAAMRVHLNDPIAEFPYKHRYVPRIRAAVGDMLRKFSQPAQ